jgi:ribosomal protein S18 acetylase RimI-like enzyme
MRIRRATEKDLDRLVEVDKEAYGKYGSNKEYFFKKLNSSPKGILVVEDETGVTGFMIFEIMNKNDTPEYFCDIELTEKIDGKWVHVPAFTTATNYKDKKSDSKLLLTAEKIAKSEGCTEACVPLSKNHPFRDNGVFEFWEMNGYKKVGEIKWMANQNEFVECYFYKKIL